MLLDKSVEDAFSQVHHCAWGCLLREAFASGAVAARRPGGPLSQSLFLAMGPRSRWIVYGGLDAQRVTKPDPRQLIFQSKRIEGFWLTSWLQRGSLFRTVQAARGVQDKFSSGERSIDVAATVPLVGAHARVPELTAGLNQGKIMLIP